ncbi:Metallo-dependent [Micractinium conductrix]|uniref:Metallo-dependent n=1 Tax=Micractinium conductrix TaxID=554055 RepID=A0A2P6VLJ3_9CHLO|nr:Metallo-dependent [Micractinium conductrix]|eukprot:PSC74940.1 Metallo-dependent [Micractinium conductrix]
MPVCQAVSLRHFRPADFDCGGRRHRRVLTVTDLHVEYAENLEFCKAIDGDAHRRDVLIVSGDVSESLPALEEALTVLTARFGAVFYTPGNHELWVRERDRAAGVHDSLTKLRLIWEACARLGVHTRPRCLGGSLWIVPVLSWHHRSFDSEPDIPGVPPVSAWTVGDYASCQWPPSVPGGDSYGSQELADWFDSQNKTPEWAALEQWLGTEGRAAADIISFSHFLPHQSLIPEKRFLMYPNLAKAVGSAPLAARLARLRPDPRQPGPDIHLFGHTHFAWDARAADGTRYMQAPLCSPAERQKRLFTVGFGASMEEARSDSVGAPWLPLCVYAGLLPAGTMDALRAQAPAGAGGAAGAAAAAGPAAAAAAAAPAGRGSGSTAGDGADAARQLRALQAQGWQPLRHGVQAPYQQAHWSDYYLTHARNPEIITLAPWVADRWVRRRARAAARRGGSGSDSSDSGTDPDTE